MRIENLEQPTAMEAPGVKFDSVAGLTKYLSSQPPLEHKSCTHLVS